ncbi:hypothetical protein FQZ97_586970 [compost metagenome]
MQLRNGAELLRQAAHADMRAELRGDAGQRGDLFVAFHQAVRIDFEVQARRQRAVLRQQQGQLAEEFLAPQRGQGHAYGQFAGVGGQPVQPQAYGFQVAIGHQVQAHGRRDEQRCRDRLLAGGGAQHQHGFDADRAAVRGLQAFGGQFEAMVFEGGHDGVLPGPFAGFRGGLHVGRAGDHDLVVAGAFRPHQPEVQPREHRAGLIAVAVVRHGLRPAAQVALADGDARRVQVGPHLLRDHHRLRRRAAGQQQGEIRSVQAGQQRRGHVQAPERTVDAFTRRAQPLVDEFAGHVAVQVRQVALAEHQDMAAIDGAAGNGRRRFERAAEFVDEVLAVRQAGDRILVELHFQRFDLGVLLFDAGVDAFARLVQGLDHAGQLGHARLDLLGRGFLADAAHVIADFAQQAVLDPSHQQEGEHRPQNARAHHQGNHLQAAAPQGFPGVGVVGDQRDFADLAPAIADRVGGRLRVQRRQRLEPGGHRRGRRRGAALDEDLAFRIGQAHQREMPAVVQRRHQQFLDHGIIVGGLREGQGQRYGGVGALHLQLARQVFPGRIDAERQRAQQDDADREGNAEQKLSKYGHGLISGHQGRRPSRSMR